MRKIFKYNRILKTLKQKMISVIILRKILKKLKFRQKLNKIKTIKIKNQKKIIMQILNY